ncbi:MAG: mechanosensitive ion channel [Rhodospirillales bacterium]|nr:mechanosensitive ion channel [Rhodospirillales bacterium]
MNSVTHWVIENVLVYSTLLQLCIIIAAFIIARISAPFLQKRIEEGKKSPWFEKYFPRLAHTILPLALPVIWLILQWLSVFIAEAAGWSSHLIESTVSLLTAWVIIRMVTSIFGDPAWSRLIAYSAWTVAALNIVDLLDVTISFLDGLAIQMGDIRISLLGVGKAALALIIMLWMAGYISNLLDRRISAFTSMTPSSRVLFRKLFRIGLFAFAVVLALESVGIDLTAFAVFSGAVGLGIGFGLQKVFSNLISGVILLLDKSVKPGDVIAIGETFGWINSLGARYVSVITRDGIEHLIPNEELISQRVENWSYTNRLIRLRVPIGVAYTSDIHEAIEVAIQSTHGLERVLVDPPPVCHLIGFGDNAVNLELRVWIQDPQKGVTNVKNEILLRIWDLYKEHGIEFPFPQRDLHLKSAVPLTITPSAET